MVTWRNISSRIGPGHQRPRYVERQISILTGKAHYDGDYYIIKLLLLSSFVTFIFLIGILAKVFICEFVLLCINQWVFVFSHTVLKLISGTRCFEGRVPGHWWPQWYHHHTCHFSVHTFSNLPSGEFFITDVLFGRHQLNWVRPKCFARCMSCTLKTHQLFEIIN